MNTNFHKLRPTVDSVFCESYVRLSSLSAESCPLSNFAPRERILLEDRYCWAGLGWAGWAGGKAPKTHNIIRGERKLPHHHQQQQQQQTIDREVFPITNFDEFVTEETNNTFQSMFMKKDH